MVWFKFIFNDLVVYVKGEKIKDGFLEIVWSDFFEILVRF